MSEANRSASPIVTGTVINDRYEIRQSLGKGGMGEVFLAYDRTTQQPSALKVVREESRMPGDDEALRQELLLAQRLVVAGHARFLAHDLERPGLLRAAIVGEEHLSHAAFAEALTNLVTIVDDGSVP